MHLILMSSQYVLNKVSLKINTLKTRSCVDQEIKVLLPEAARNLILHALQEQQLSVC